MSEEKDKTTAKELVFKLFEKADKLENSMSNLSQQLKETDIHQSYIQESIKALNALNEKITLEIDSLKSHKNKTVGGFRVVYWVLGIALPLIASGVSYLYFSTSDNAKEITIIKQEFKEQLK